MEIEKIALYLNVITVVVLASLYFICLGQSLRALMLGCKVTPIQILFMKIRKMDVDLIITNLAKSTKGNLSVTVSDIEIHLITGGDISNVINGLLYAKAHGISLTFQEAARMDMKKYDVISHLKKSAN